MSHAPDQPSVGVAAPPPRARPSPAPDPGGSADRFGLFRNLVERLPFGVDWSEEAFAVIVLRIDDGIRDPVLVIRRRDPEVTTAGRWRLIAGY